ncbi:unnamed protein product [Mytilus edulis]|uniref:DZIP3-like HEPN domain-containing protein n=1 Tax=Mytilus edulis TaxID=6550 RepID=A0A8S3Q786_MYTED|nr:unnamed protein product [Mytilus edulis]
MTKEEDNSLRIVYLNYRVGTTALRRSPLVSSADLDVTLMVCLLRNLPPYVSPPASGFDALPLSNDLSHGAHIARIKYYKNFIVSHSKDGKLSDTVCNRIWIDLEMAIHGLGNQQDVIDAADAKSKVLDFNALKELLNVGFSFHRNLERLNDYACHRRNTTTQYDTKRIVFPTETIGVCDLSIGYVIVIHIP